MTAVLGVLAGGVLAVLVFGLVTGRIPWRTRGCCCPVDPADDVRMRDAIGPDRAAS